MATTHESLNVSDIHTSGQARLHIGNNNEHHDHHYHGDESQLPPAERQRKREDAILSSLSFTDMNARERVIDSPCDETFGWIFDEQVTERTRYQEKNTCNLMSQWLEHEHGMFFIVGKAGSGKSTLMRFLAGHKQTSTLLQSWARRHDCVLTVCTHYFWCSGSQLQSSQEGLWRSILHAIAKADRRLASAMFVELARDAGQTLAQLRSQPWARNDLIVVLSLLVAHLEVQKVAVCLFIDGLDEYKGDEMMLIAELRQLLESPYIKICTSSRPRNLFEGAFGHEDHQWKLALHLLTQGDMNQLTRTRLYEDDAFCELIERGDRGRDFVTAIADKSQGVFLWTVLVIREMIREAHQAGTIDELKERLDTLPIELGGEKGMYQRIVERSDPRYRKYMARLLLVMLEPGPYGPCWEDVHFLYQDDRDAAFATRECLGLDDKYRLAWDRKLERTVNQPWEAGFTHISCRVLFLVCHQGRSGAHPRGVNCQVHRTSLIEDTRRQVRKWCPDFVDTNEWTAELPKACDDQMWHWLQFSHRSVGEYLSLPEIREQMTDLAGRGFDPVLTRCRLRLAHSRLEPGERQWGNFEQDFMRMIACVGHERVDFVRAILPEFERIQDTKWSLIPEKDKEERNVLDRLWAKSFCYHYSRGNIILHGGFGITRSAQAHAWFLSLVAREGLVWYCREHWSQIPTSDQQDVGTIIIAGLLSNTISLEISQEQVDLVQCLICSSVDPNTIYTWLKHDGGYMLHSAGQMEMSLWEAYVEAFPDVWMSMTENGVRWALEVMQLLLRDGRADKQCCLPAGKKSLLSALTFEPHFKQEFLNVQNRYWNMFAGRLHELLDAHGLLTREERHVALEKGWIPTQLKAPQSHSPRTAQMQSAAEPDVSLFSQWLGNLKEWEESIRPYM